MLEYHAHRYDDLYNKGELDNVIEDDEFDLDRILDEMNNDNNWETVNNDS